MNWFSISRMAASRLGERRLRRASLGREFLLGTDLPVVKRATAMPGIAGGVDQDFDVPERSQTRKIRALWFERIVTIGGHGTAPELKGEVVNHEGLLSITELHQK